MTFVEFGPNSGARVPQHNRLRGLAEGNPHPQYLLADESIGWRDYTPLLTASVTTPTLGTDAKVDGRYTQVRSTVDGWASIEFGTAGTNAGSGTYFLSLPVTPRRPPNQNVVIGTGYVFDTSASELRNITVVLDTTGIVILTLNNEATTVVTEGGPWAWAASDQIHIDFRYEAAA